MIKNIFLNQIKSYSHSTNPVVFRQLFDTISSTYTYLIADKNTKEAILIDPVFECYERDINLIKELDLKLKYCVNTHCHADHVTSSGKIKKNFNSNVKSIISALSEAQADIKVNEGDKIKFGDQELSCLSTPGHTNGCFSFVDHKNKFVYTGDTLLVRGCGRTDFQQGSSESLYESVHKKIFTLPDDYTVLPAHDYNGFTSSTVREEKINNPRLTKSKDDFIFFMSNLQLDLPKLIDLAVPANMVCGIQENLFKTKK